MLSEKPTDEFGWGAKEEPECHHEFPNGDMPDNKNDVCRWCKRTAKEIWPDHEPWKDE